MSIDAAAAFPREPLPDRVKGARATGWWGMVWLICTEAMLFASYFASWIFLSETIRAFGEEGGRYPPLGLPSLMTVLLASSSIAAWWGEKGIEKGDQGRLRLGLAIAWLLGAAFIVCQVIEYSHKSLGPDSGAYHSLFYTITTTHGVHLAAGLLMGAVVQLRAWLGHFTRERHLAVQNTVLYLHFVDGVWMVIFLLVYVSPHFWRR
ncbi:MAG TPA: cytochrome c oxidase subunit 3 [Longimicrobium sp.]|nr:cytochrome c oxidase subunit 3 [Longimicrobium sp.]